MKLKIFFSGLLCVPVLFVWLYVKAQAWHGTIHDTKEWTITITDGNKSITIADKNVWATVVWYWKDASPDSYWLYYQWGGMTGYKYDMVKSEAVLSWFVLGLKWRPKNIEVWWTLDQQSELCGEWYRIATHTDWEKILKMYENLWGFMGDFAEDFKFPLGWYRSHIDGEMGKIGEVGEVWTTSSKGDWYASYFRVEESGADNSYGSIYSYWHAIRCIKNDENVHSFSWVLHNTKEWTITITNGNSSITIADKNVWATVVWYGPEASWLSYGDYYQRWWTTGYAYFLDKDGALAEGFVSHPFSSQTWEWDRLTADIQSWEGADICWKWYHVPSAWEWRILKYLFEANWNQLTDFYEAFLIPVAGERTYFDVEVSQDRFNANLWSSTRWGENSIYYLYWHEDNIQTFGSSPANAFPVRCFQDVKPVNLWSSYTNNKANQTNTQTNPVNNQVNNINNQVNNPSNNKTVYNKPGDELAVAHQFAYKNGITSIADVSNAKMYSSLTRIAMAKMLSQYAINVLWKTPNTSKVANFGDVPYSLDRQYSNGVTLAYQLGIMWVWMDNFRPNDTVTRAEFGTALSRMLYWLPDWKDHYYTTHLNKLYKEWIITNTDPKIKELRWYVMIMLMRAADKENNSQSKWDVWNVVNDTSSSWKIVEDVRIGKWKITYNSRVNVSYIDTEWNEFNKIWTITYSDHEWNSITMLDRNLWAIESWTWKKSYWYYFWRGNNYWFKEAWRISDEGRWWNYSWNNPYVNKDINLNSYNANRDLWWWSNDNEGNSWNPYVNNWYMRQWPCPAWYHIPSVWERTRLIRMWFKDEYWMDIEYIDWMFYQYYWNLVDEFTKDFRLPYAWSEEENIWKVWQYWWSSLWDSRYNYAYELRLFPKKEIDVKIWETPHTIVIWWSALWWRAKLSVRCFKDEYEDSSSVITLSYETNWWTKMQSQTLQKWSVWFLPWYTTYKEWYELEWWYLNKELDEVYDFSTKLNKDTTIYAKWKSTEDELSGDWNELTRLTDDEIKQYYYNNCSCPNWYSYMPESVTYYDPWCEINICENGSKNCTLYVTSFSNECRNGISVNKVGSWIPSSRKVVENYYKENCSCPAGFDFAPKTADTYADSCNREYCVDAECKEIKTRHVWVKDLCPTRS